MVGWGESSAAGRGYPTRTRMEVTREQRLGDADAATRRARRCSVTRSPSRRRRTGLRAGASAKTRSGGRAPALLHDFDYEIHPTLDRHPQDGAPILREEGWPEEVIEAVLSHAEHRRASPARRGSKKTLFACDELSGFVIACGHVRPDGLDTLEPRSVRKKLKQPSFAAGVTATTSYTARRGSVSTSTSTSRS